MNLQDIIFAGIIAAVSLGLLNQFFSSRMLVDDDEEEVCTMFGIDE